MTTYVTPADLLAAVKAVEPHVGKDQTLSVLCAVRIERRGRQLTLTATDRFTLGRYVLDVDEQSDGDDWALQVSVQDIATIKRVVTGYRTVSAACVGFTVADGVLSVTAPDQSATFRQWHDGFPAVDTLFEKAITAAGASPAGSTRSYTPDYLARFAKAAGKGDALTVHAATGESGATLVTVGDNFVGLIMTLRTAQADIPSRLVESVDRPVSLVKVADEAA